MATARKPILFDKSTDHRHDDMVVRIQHSVQSLIEKWHHIDQDKEDAKVAKAVSAHKQQLMEALAAAENSWRLRCENENHASTCLRNNDPRAYCYSCFSAKELIERKQAYTAFLSQPVPEREPAVVEIDDIRWEVPIENRGFIYGFVDLLVPIHIPRWTCDFSASIPHEPYVHCLSKNPSASVVLDFVEKKYVFDAKPEIRSVGEVIRQMNSYATVLKAQYVIVSDDDKYADVFQQQGIIFVRLSSLP